MATSSLGIKSKWTLMSEKLNIEWNVVSVSHAYIIEVVGILLQKVA
jgi:hypothetical protein